ncbi:hypothetical protein [Actinoallomurus sp. CA-150999]|uniref:hypothetical protein n=1 Tax=Actinoallomurus sp. CA-150999 TaxID=3239887 RepID=UPI003D8F44AB
MRLPVKRAIGLSAATVTATAGLALAAGSADAATTGQAGAVTAASGPTMHTMTRGVSGCFAYSYNPGITTTTVYWHNRCKTTHNIKIWVSASRDWCFVVKGHKKGHAAVPTPKPPIVPFPESVTGVKQVKKCS